MKRMSAQDDTIFSDSFWCSGRLDGLHKLSSLYIIDAICIASHIRGDVYLLCIIQAIYRNHDNFLLDITKRIDMIWLMRNCQDWPAVLKELNEEQVLVRSLNYSSRFSRIVVLLDGSWLNKVEASIMIAPAIWISDMLSFRKRADRNRAVTGSI